ncbi:DNA (cytosine-5-)-methyltransferase [Catenulispora yoronensis]|uniref:DNA (cytosine-5-)-methyltransferase n=1 Tax=Catenulispora yoronensis TaxID=450799 RepID=A0ABN2U3M5_9ACTN
MIEQREDHREVGTSVELFAGGGGLAMALHEAGFRHLLLNEFAKRACETLRANQATKWLGTGHVPQGFDDPWPLIEGPVQDVDFTYLNGKVDVLAGGPPCQPFSLGGDHKGHEDERNMFPQFFRAVRETRPRAFICENVRGLLRPSFAPYFQYIVNELSMPFVERGDTSWEDHNEQIIAAKAVEPDGTDEAAQRYVVFVTPVNAADFGVPQVRNRVIIVGFRLDLGVDTEVWEKFRPRKTHSEASLNNELRDPRSAYWRRHKKVPAAVRKQVIARTPVVSPDDDELRFKPWRTLRDAVMGNPDAFPALPPLPQTGLIDYEEHPESPATNHIGWPGARVYTGHTPNLLDRPAKTVKAGVHGVPGGESVMMLDDGTHRYMTVRETARVMTFPDDWKPVDPRGEQMRQLGNAVPVLLGQRFAEAVSDVLRSVAESAGSEDESSRAA